ncbi:hypothetical protein CCH79_00014968 [Gambusia affinis]|uniref:Endoplasmic reticulum-Golgi intermediate compartment protein n=1 Tax=Gambusia affinis TaxID=33528 RepID=A0A315W2G9_GAMAF|nr:hypothetical protein CCH79_00014968 [Gambusia affinis]
MFLFHSDGPAGQCLMTENSWSEGSPSHSEAKLPGNPTDLKQQLHDSDSSTNHHKLQRQRPRAEDRREQAVCSASSDSLSPGTESGGGAESGDGRARRILEYVPHGEGGDGEEVGRSTADEQEAPRDSRLLCNSNTHTASRNCSATAKPQACAFLRCIPKVHSRAARVKQQLGLNCGKLWQQVQRHDATTSCVTRPVGLATRINHCARSLLDSDGSSIELGSPELPSITSLCPIADRRSIVTPHRQPQNLDTKDPSDEKQGTLQQPREKDNVPPTHTNTNQANKQRNEQLGVRAPLISTQSTCQRISPFLLARLVGKRFEKATAFGGAPCAIVPISHQWGNLERVAFDHKPAHIVGLPADTVQRGRRHLPTVPKQRRNEAGGDLTHSPETPESGHALLSTSVTSSRNGVADEGDPLPAPPLATLSLQKAVLTAKMRRLSRRKALSLVKELDAFPKVADSYVETSASGGTVSIIAFSAMAVLAILEFFVYRDTWMKYEYQVDKDFSRTLCLLQSRLREEHALQEVLYKTPLKGAPTALPPREDAPNEPPNACRIHGHAYVNKVAGNLHITVGKPIHHPQGHAHIAAFVSHEAYNFSHRIDHLSFGEEVPGIINPLDGTEKITYNNNQMYQYFITVVPTKLNTHLISADTHQFSVTERERVINHAAGSHGVSGIFVKYDTSSLMVTVSEQHMALGRFLVRLCGIVGGIFSTTGMLHSLVGFCFDIVCCRFRLGAYRPRQVSPVDSVLDVNTRISRSV